MKRASSVAVFVALPLLLGACAGRVDDGNTSATDASTGGRADGMGGDGMGGDGMGGDGALGGTAETILLAEVVMDTLPKGPLNWIAFPVSNVIHEHAASFVHAREATSTTIDGEKRQLEAGEVVFVAAGTAHEHGPGTAWDVLLAHPEVNSLSGLTRGPIFRSDQLEGLPEGAAQLRALLVELPPGAQTSVHTHPGPEYIYATSGRFSYENAIIGETETREGDHHTLPADTAVQKRNPEGPDTAAFLSWFVVAPDQPFAPSATLD